MKTLKIIYLIALSLLSVTANSQNGTWYFGSSSSILFGNAPNNNPPSIYAPEGSAVLYDDDGTVLFYTNGLEVKNGTDVLQFDGLMGDWSSTQNVVIVPSICPESCRRYFIFTVDATEDDFVDGWRVTQVEVTGTAPNTTVAVVPGELNKLIELPEGAIVGEKITVVPDDNSGFWVVTHGIKMFDSDFNCWNNYCDYGDYYFTVHVTPSICSTEDIVAVGQELGVDVEVTCAPYGSGNCEFNTSAYRKNAGGQLKFNQQHNMSAMALPTSRRIQITDFDNSTGTFSNARSVSVNLCSVHEETGIIESIAFVYGIEFSPSGEYLYGTTINAGAGAQVLFQLSNLTSLLGPTICDTYEEIYHKLTGDLDFWLGALQLGPDNKIYVAIPTGTEIGVIQDPDNDAANCNFIDNFSISGYSCKLGLPQCYQTSDINVVELGSDQLICNETLTLDAGSGFTNYIWTQPGNCTVNGQYIYACEEGEYCVTVTDPLSGCNSTDCIYLTMSESPPVSILANDQNIICGESTTLTVLGCSGCTYLWSTGQTGTAIQVDPMTSTTYSITATNTDGCTSVATNTISVSQITTSIFCANPSIMCGETVTLSASGCIDCTYLWSNGATTSSITVSPTMSISFTVTVTNSAGCTATASQLVTVTPISISINASDINLDCYESSTTLSATGCNFCNYVWSTGATTSSITVSPLSTTTYTVTVSYPDCADAVASQTIIKEDCYAGQYCMRINKAGDNDIGYAIERTIDGGYVIAGSMYSNDGLSNKDVYVVKYSSAMVQEFAYRLGGEYGDEGISILPRSDGYYIAGTIKISPNESDIFIIKLNPNGTLSWSNRYGNNNGSQEQACKIITASNSALMVIGSSNSGGNYNVLALKLYTDGTIVGKKIYYTGNLTSNEIAYDAIKVGSGIAAFYVITGEQYTSAADKNMFALKIKEDFTIADDRIITNPGRSEIGYSLTSTPTGIYIAGTINSPTSGVKDVYIVGLSLNNFTVALGARVYSAGANVEIARQIKRMANGDLVIAGTTSVPNNINGFIMRISSTDLSNVIWSKSTNELNKNERFMDFVEGAANFITITGSWWEASGEDIFISKITSAGDGCCMINYPLTSSPLYFSTKGFLSKDIGLHFTPYGSSTSYYNAEVICSKPSTRIGDGDTYDNNIIKVFPNPASDKLTIQLENTSEYINEVTIYDISGRSVLNSISKNTIEVLDVSKLLNGVYVVKVRGESQTWNTLINISK